MLNNFFQKSIVNSNKIYFFLLDQILGLFKENHRELLMRTICQALQTLENNERQISFNIAPQNALEIPFLQGLNQMESFAIVLQGPLCDADDMTCKTIEFYRKMYPQAQIILSTWEGEDENICSRAENMNAIVIRNKKPVYAGIKNVNYQLTSSLNGVKRAEELGCYYVAKTRTDQRVCKPYVFDFMINLLRLFPLSEVCNQKERIIFLSMYSGNIFSPYYMSDFLYFGTIYDMKNLLSAPLDFRESFQLGQGSSRKENAEKMYPPEIYIMKHYFKDVIGYPCSDTVKEYWNIVKNHLISLDSKTIGLMWNKYNRRFELNRFWGDYFGNLDNENIMATLNFTFTNWLNLYSGTMKYQSEYEGYTSERLNL